MGGYRGGFGGFGGGNQMQNLMKQAQKMQEEMQKAQAELEETEVVGTSGGGLVKITMTAKKVFTTGLRGITPILRFSFGKRRRRSKSSRTIPCR